MYTVQCTVLVLYGEQLTSMYELYSCTNTPLKLSIQSTIQFTTQGNLISCYAPVQYLEGGVEVVLVFEHNSKSDVNLVLAAESRIYVQHLLECFSCPGDVCV